MVGRCYGLSALAFLLLGSSAAHALEPKQCLPIAEINAALKAEGQRTLILGDREALHDPIGNAKDITVTRYANAVTANADGSLGYQLEGDLPRAQASTSMCVRARLTHIRLFDAHSRACRKMRCSAVSSQAQQSASTPRACAPCWLPTRCIRTVRGAGAAAHRWSSSAIWNTAAGR